MKVLALGLPRTGTLAMADALTLLGYENVYHTQTFMDKKNKWDILSRAADASFSALPTYTGQPFTREEWDEVFGSCEAVTEAAAMFGPQLIKTYPNAKVVLVKRDYDAWAQSFEKVVFNTLWGARSEMISNVLHPLVGLSTIPKVRKILLGFFEAKNVNEARKNARRTYDQHHDEIKQMVAPAQLLIYKMGDGWGPLCEFLGKPIPEIPWIVMTGAIGVILASVLRRSA